ncbi:MAG: tetratricopeptide repeat protein [Gammaproteobacteria bacterium]|nr:tetratricopeptide repeat protein [Gammaproteobacteria bacterium]
MPYSYFRLKNFTQAAQHFSVAVQLYATFSEAYSYLALALLELGHLEKAMSSAESALQCNPRSAEIQSDYAQICEAWGDYEKALKYYRQASEGEPRNLAYQVNLALALLAVGDAVAAEAAFRSAIALKPLYGEPYWGLARMGLITLADNEIIQHLEQSVRFDKLEPHHKAPMLFALGHIYHRHGDCEKAFAFFRGANRVDDQVFGFSIEGFTTLVNRIIKAFTAELINRYKCKVPEGPTPIFVVGMPRSGSSPLEQILAGHHEIFGAGELQWFNGIESKLNVPGLYPESVCGLSADKLGVFGQEYTDYLKSLSQGEPYVVDKCLVNFLHLGLLRMVFPTAKIIHCRRNVRDTCISIFFNRVPKGVFYGCDLFKLGAYYQLYVRLMEHWHKVMPDNILNVDYEDMVSDPELTSRRIIEFIGIEWDPACLDNQKTTRAVRIASDHQVRKPVYRSSINRWKPYEGYLEELERGLAIGLDE